MATLEAGPPKGNPSPRCLENGGTREQGDLEPPLPKQTPSTEPPDIEEKDTYLTRKTTTSHGELQDSDCA